MEREIKKYKINPSLPEIGYHMRDFKKSIRSTGKRDGMVAGKLTTIYTDERINGYEDVRIYYKFFKGQLAKIAALTTVSQRIYFHILETRIQYGKHSFLFIGVEGSKELDISMSSLNRAMQELLDKEFIYRTDMKGMYFLNLTIVSFCKDEDIYKEFVHTVMR